MVVRDYHAAVVVIVAMLIKRMLKIIPKLPSGGPSQEVHIRSLANNRGKETVSMLQ